MKKIGLKDLWIFLAQVAVWFSAITLPAMTAFLASWNFETAINTVKMVWFNFQSPCLLYFINFYIFWPLLFSKRRYVLFVVANIVAMVALNFGLFYIKDYAANSGFELPDNAWIGVLSGLSVYFLLNCTSIGAAIATRHIIRTRQIKKQLEEERHKSTEAELAWLKNQINPHFLFNTLNNISSLTQIDADAAQDSIAQLSDLLRYAIYKTNQPTVPLSGEVEFMRNYISLMQLRCNEKTTVNTEFNVTTPQQEIAPLLFISLIENAFKHGVSSNKPSYIDIKLEQTDDSITFSCSNTNFPKSDSDRSGKGIGLENTRRRLELQYDGRYQWEQQQDEYIYNISITIHP